MRELGSRGTPAARGGGFGGGRLGRPESPVDPEDGPVERFAWELRQLRERAGGPSYRVLAKRAHYAASTLADAAKGHRLPTLDVALAYARACGAPPQEWETRWRATEAALRDADREREERQGRGPYPGLAAFGVEDAPWFFGRSGLIKQLVEQVACAPLVAVSGVSGSGKSSLLRAGLLPALEPHWHPIFLTPGDHPLESLAAAIAALANSTISVDGGSGPDREPATLAGRLVRRLAEDATALELALATWLASRPGEEQVVLVIDQFEEVFTLCEREAERDALLSAVAQLVCARPARIRVVLGIRADFYAHCFAHPGLVAALRTGVQLPVGLPTSAELREILVEPAARRGVSIDADLLEAVLADAADQPGALPLVAHVMREIWRCRKGGTLRLADYRACGGVSGAVALTAERVHSQASSVQQVAIRALFLRLTAIGDGTEDTRRRVTLDELDGLELGVLLQDLVAARLIVTGDCTVEVAHEAVIRAWPRLRRWLSDDRDALRVHHRLTAAARNWHELGRDVEALYRGVQFTVAREWADAHPKALNNQEADFLRASAAAAHQRTRRTRQLMAALSVLLAMALIATAIAVKKTTAADTQRRLATSRELAARADQLSEQRPEAAMILALKGYRQAPTIEARGSLLSAHARYNANQLTGHTQPVESSDFAPDGRTLATASFDHTVKLWDARSHRLLATLTGHTDVVNTVAYSPDGRTLATASNDRSVKLWDARSHRLLATLTGHTNMAEAVAFSPDGRTLASAGSDRTVRLWDARTYQERAVLTGHTDAVLRLAFSPDGHMLATADSGRTTRLWDTSTHKSLAVLAGRTGAVTTVAFSPDGRTLATAGNDDSVKLWDVRSRRLLATLKGHTRKVQEVTFSPNGHTLASASIDGTVRIWRPQTGKALATLTVKQPVYAVAFSPDGRTLATSGQDSTARLWNVASHRPVATLSGRTGAIASPASFTDLPAVLTVDYDNQMARWSTTTPRSHPAPIRPPEPVTGSVASSDGQMLAAAGEDRAIRVWNLTTGRHTTTLAGATDTVRQLAITPDGSTLAASSNDGTIRVWDVATRRTTTVLRDARTVVALSISPDGRTLASVSTDGTTRLWTVRPGETGTPLPGPKDANMALAFSPDGRTLAVGNTDNSVRLWDVTTHRTTATLATNAGFVRAVAFSPRGSTLATTNTDGTVRLWDTRATRLQATLTGPTMQGIPTVRFSPDGRTLATFGPHDAARVWTTDANQKSSNANYVGRVWRTDVDYVATRVCRLSAEHDWARLIPDQPVEDLCPS
ncbi:nSTAND1 domain-containing NTPase [Streptomyces lasiicapitis]|uniref:HTH cro/C1-type domain-containing protein n=1 Tax=Streptomyces lasiicapitis TaxID=1923961 RepID=A0ABQ2M4Y5_9ACTN|nr:helix-turn-helix domain-containing protein [Streptomyces lasiicapitis]GGO45978.1 hypothetical protein GCM10012286_35810 [Streptomyces lasiicapitis]